MEVVPLQVASTLQNIRENPLNFSPILSRLCINLLLDFNDLLENTMSEIPWYLLRAEKDL